MTLPPLTAHTPHMFRERFPFLVVTVLALSWLATSATAQAPSSRFPDIVIVTIDTLRSDRLSSYGYERPTSPRIDALVDAGVRFTEARVPEPLTAPSMISMVTSLYPHEHGTSRNGLRMRPDLLSLPKILKKRRYHTAAFISNWTLKDELSGLGEHFDEYHEVFTRKRWYVFADEATGDDVTAEALGWLGGYAKQDDRRPFLLWAHYVEPHEPYRLHEEFAERLGIDTDGKVPVSDRYDTEIAFVDRSVGNLLDGVEKILGPSSAKPLILFASDHGESLGEHGYWGHGRHLYEPTLHIPMSITWEGRLEPRTLDAPASLLDLTPTVFGLLDLPVHPAFQGIDWTPVLRGNAEPNMDRVTYHQAHKGAVQRSGNQNARRQGLLEVGQVEHGQKEILRVTNDKHWLFDLTKDPKELANKASGDPSAELHQWLEKVREGLASSDALPPAELDEEAIEKLRALGYID